MQRILRRVAYTANGLCALVLGVLGLGMFFVEHYKVGFSVTAIAMLAAFNIFVFRMGAQPLMEQQREASYLRRVAQRHLLRGLSVNAERIVLPPRFLTHFACWLFCLVFFSIIVFLDYIGHASAWPGIIFAFGILYFPVVMLPGATYIEINQEGVTFSAAFIRSFYPWYRIADFQVIPYLRREGVALHYKPEYQRGSWWHVLNRTCLRGFDRIIMSQHCGIDAYELCRLMRNFQSRAMAAAAAVDFPASLPPLHEHPGKARSDSAD